MVQIGELTNGDLYVPTPPEYGVDGGMTGGVMRRVTAGSIEHNSWMREVEAGRVALVRRDRSRRFVWIDDTG